MRNAAIKKQPNVLIFMTDQQSSYTLCDGHYARAKNPHLDRFRQRAVTFTNAYTPSPHCCPSRASFFTSKYPSEHGVWNNVNVTNALSRGPREATPFWSRDLKQAGYDLAFSGKWHVSNSEQPADFGWKELKVTAQGSGVSLSADEQRSRARTKEIKLLESYNPALTVTNRQPGQIIRPGWPNYTHFGTDENPFDDLLVVDTAIKQVKSYADTSDEALPWCMYVGTLGPHDPYTPPSKYLDWYDLSDIELPQSFDDTMDDKPGLYRRTRDRFDQLTAEEHRDAIRHYLAFCSYEDALFGKLVSALEETDQLDNTVVVFLSDHGDYLGEHGLWGKGLPAFQSAYRIPLVIGGPGISPDLQGAQLDHPTSIVDVGPTIVELCDVEPSYQVSGTSLVPLLTNSSQETPKPDVFFQSNGNEAYGIQRAVISDGWKLVYNMFDQDELYDLGKDPEEITNLLADPVGQRKVGRGPLDSIPSNLRAKVEELYRKLWKFGIAHDDENINGYVLTALAPFGPGIVADPSSSKNYLGNDEANSLNTQQLSGSTPV